MNGRKANWAFLITIVGYIGMSCSLVLFFPELANSLFWSNLLCELVVILPVLIFIFVSGERPGAFLGFSKMKTGSALMTVLFSLLTMPALSLFNLISQLWVENEVAAMLESQQAGQMPFGLLYLSVGIIAPVFEEITCRGAYYRSYRKSGSAFKAMILSALLFALVHMNFNQAAYAFVMGILAVLLVEATGSIWSSILYHGVVNGSQILLMYEVLKTDPGIYSSQSEMITKDLLLYGIGAYLILTTVTLPLAWAVLVWISSHEGRDRVLSRIWKERKEKKDKMVTVPLVLALILCLGMITGAFILIYQYCFRYLG